jgi:hypothetical protein
MGPTIKIVLVVCTLLVVVSLFYVPRTIAGLQSSSNVLKINESFQSVPTARDRKSLPDLSNGGVIVFYHIYKTGGSTIGKLLHEMAQKNHSQYETQKNHKNVLSKDKRRDGDVFGLDNALTSPSPLFFTMIRRRIDWEQECLKSLDLAQNHKKLMLLELHVEHPAPDFPSLVEFAPTLDRWRAEADRRGVGFFAFTLVREPVAHALSFFNFFHVGSDKIRPPPTRNDHDFWNPFRPLKKSEKDFLRSYYASNRQCRMFKSDPEATKGAPHDLVWDRKLLSAEELATSRRPCQVENVHDAFFNSLDWVGTTEMMQNETLPLLTHLVANDASLGRNNAPFKVFDKNPTGFRGMKKVDLSDKTMATILERTTLDRQLYSEVTQRFRLTDLGWDYRSPVNG